MTGKIGNPLNGAALKQFISTPTWSIKPLISPKGSNEISDDVVKKVVKLSGLKTDNPQMISQFRSSLNVQLGFIKSLYKDGMATSDVGKTNDRLFRLIKSDHDGKGHLSLKDIEESIKKLDSQVDRSKGEIGYKRDGFFIVNN